MATNTYFRSNYFATDQDQKLADDLIVEMIYNYGIDVKYLPRDFVDFDKIYGEDDSSLFDDVYTVEMYVKNVNGFNGDGNFLSKFGIEIRDEMTFSVSRRRFTEEVLAHETGMTRPREGDLIAVPSVVDRRRRLFEISYVAQEEVYYQFGSLYTWELRCKTFEYTGENFETGDADIDSIEQHKLYIEATLGSGNGIDFVVDEQISVQGTLINAKVISFDTVNNKVVIGNQNGDILKGQVLVGATSQAMWAVDSIKQAESLTYSDTREINSEAAGIVLFDEKNPFSE